MADSVETGNGAGNTKKGTCFTISHKVFQRKPIFLIVLTLTIVLFCQLLLLDKHNSVISNIIFKTRLAENLKRTEFIIPRRNKTIVFYTAFFGGSWDSYLRNRRTDLAFHGCPVTECVFSFDRAMAPVADAVIFHETGFNPGDIPVTRGRHQRYIWMNVEAPCPYDKDRVDTMHGYPGFFNWSSSYHRSSETTMPYGGIVPREEHGLPNRLFPLDKNHVAYEKYVKDLANGIRLQDEPNATRYLPENCSFDTFYKRPKLVAWMVSHCNTAAGREVYINELLQYIPVDIYGACGNLSCGRNHLDVQCYQKELQPNYKFYLSFENSWCNDYVTEKVWIPLLYGIVPVVYGGVTYSEYLPPNSYVDATLLKPKELADKLTSIASSDEEYATYHLWRKYWRGIVPAPMCDICERLHNDNKEAFITDLWKYWINLNNCTEKYPGRQY